MQAHTQPTKDTTATLQVSSPAFEANAAIPVAHAVEGDNVPPPLHWSAVPAGTRSIAVVVEDPDAPGRTFVHWIVVGIPPQVTHLDPNELPDGAAHGRNDRGELGWMGPSPPSGRHRYFFKVFALDIVLDEPGLTRRDLDAAMSGHVLARGELIGTYEKRAGKRPRV